MNDNGVLIGNDEQINPEAILVWTHNVRANEEPETREFSTESAARGYIDRLGADTFINIRTALLIPVKEDKS